MEKNLLERIEENRLLKEAERVLESYSPQDADSFNDVLVELGLNEPEIDGLIDSVVIDGVK
jgi:hypothetical protein